jgi:hypothetical protein
MAIWRQAQVIVASEYTPGSGWSAPQPVNDGSAVISGEHQLALDAAGNALVVWGAEDSIYANVFTAGSGWGSTVPIETVATPDNFQGPRLAMNGNGAALVTWSDFTSQEVHAIRYVPGTGWGSAALPGIGVAPWPVIDAAGNATILWHRFAGSGGTIETTRFASGASSWSAPLPLESDSTHYNQSPAAGADAQGNVIAVWNYLHPDGSSIQGRRFTPGSGWGPVFTLDPGAEAFYVQLAVTPAGHALAVWHNNSGSAYQLRSSHYVPGAGWSAALTVDSSSDSQVFHSLIDLKLASDATGALIWQELDDTGTRQYGLKASRFQP